MDRPVSIVGNTDHIVRIKYYRASFLHIFYGQRVDVMYDDSVSENVSSFNSKITPVVPYDDPVAEAFPFGRRIQSLI